MGDYGRNAHRLFTTNSFAGLETGQNLLAAFLAGGIEQLPPGMRSSPRLMRDFLRSAAAQTDAPYSKLPLVVGVDDEGMVEFEMTDQDVVKFLQELDPAELAELQRRNPDLFTRGPPPPLVPPPLPPPLPPSRPPPRGKMDPCAYLIDRADPNQFIQIGNNTYNIIDQIVPQDGRNTYFFNGAQIKLMLERECNIVFPSQTRVARDPCDYFTLLGGENGIYTANNGTDYQIFDTQSKSLVMQSIVQMLIDNCATMQQRVNLNNINDYRFYVAARDLLKTYSRVVGDARAGDNDGLFKGDVSERPDQFVGADRDFAKFFEQIMGVLPNNLNELERINVKNDRALRAYYFQIELPRIISNNVGALIVGTNVITNSNGFKVNGIDITEQQKDDLFYSRYGTKVLPIVDLFSAFVNMATSVSGFFNANLQYIPSIGEGDPLQHGVDMMNPDQVFARFSEVLQRRIPAGIDTQGITVRAVQSVNREIQELFGRLQSGMQKTDAYKGANPNFILPSTISAIDALYTNYARGASINETDLDILFRLKRAVNSDVIPPSLVELMIAIRTAYPNITTIEQFKTEIGGELERLLNEQTRQYADLRKKAVDEAKKQWDADAIEFMRQKQQEHVAEVKALKTELDACKRKTDETTRRVVVHEQQRIAELEAEVARLRGELATRAEVEKMEVETAVENQEAIVKLRGRAAAAEDQVEQLTGAMQKLELDTNTEITRLERELADCQRRGRDLEASGVGNAELAAALAAERAKEAELNRKLAECKAEVAREKADKDAIYLRAQKASEAQSRQIEELRKEYAELEQLLEKTQDKLQDATDKQKRLEREREECEREKGDVKAKDEELADVKLRLEAANRELQDLHTKCDSLLTRVEAAPPSAPRAELLGAIRERQATPLDRPLKVQLQQTGEGQVAVASETTAAPRPATPFFEEMVARAAALRPAVQPATVEDVTVDEDIDELRKLTAYDIQNMNQQRLFELLNDTRYRAWILEGLERLEQKRSGSRSRAQIDDELMRLQNKYNFNDVDFARLKTQVYEAVIELNATVM